MAYEPPFERNDGIDSLCMEIAELVGRISPNAPLAKSTTLHRKLRIKIIHSSLMIEGNALDETAVTAVLDGKRVLGDRRDILEVENAKRAYDLIPELDPYSLKDLLKAHGIMMEGLVPEAGRSRSGDVGVFDGDTLIRAGTPATYVPEVMGNLFEWLATSGMHPLLASCVFHLEFEFCHPFRMATAGQEDSGVRCCSHGGGPCSPGFLLRARFAGVRRTIMRRLQNPTKLAPVILSSSSYSKLFEMPCCLSRGPRANGSPMSCVLCAIFERILGEAFRTWPNASSVPSAVPNGLFRGSKMKGCLLGRAAHAGTSGSLLQTSAPRTGSLMEYGSRVACALS